MTTTRTSNNAIVTVRPLDVLGREFLGFLSHAMICDEPALRDDVCSNTLLRVAHMCPPIVASTFKCDVVAGIVLTEPERRKIQRFVERFRKEMEANAIQMQLVPLDQIETLPTEPRYLIHPERMPPKTGYTLWSFSCVGFVVAAYKNGRITLLSPDRPLKSLDDLKRLYPRRAAQLDDPDKRGELLPEGGDSWPVALVGYLFNAFNRNDEEIRQTPFQPELGDEHFPSQRPPAVPIPTIQ
jgi:hypothetical protein